MRSICVSKREAGQRLDKLLLKYLDQAPKSFLYKMLRKKNITLNQKKAEGSEKLVEGDNITLFLSEETIASFSGSWGNTEMNVKREVGEHLPFRVVYEDLNLLIVDKECGILSQKSKQEDVSLVEWITEYLLRSGSLAEQELIGFHPGVCNRLDRNTSGLVLTGKSLLGLQFGTALFRERRIQKFYSCIVAGEMKSGGSVKGWLSKDESSNLVFISAKKSEESCFVETTYRPLCAANGYTLLEVQLITGKTHQIRAHLSSIGFPVAGDFKYGNKKTNQILKKRFGLNYQLLHAERMEFPELGEPFEALSNRKLCAEPPALFLQIKEELLCHYGTLED